MASENKSVINPSRSLVQNARRTKALINRPELVRRVSARERRRTREQRPLTNDEKNSQNNYSSEILKGNNFGARAIGNRLRRGNAGKLGPQDIRKDVGLAKVAKDATKIYSTLSPLLIFVPVQFAFAIISLMGLAFEVASANFAFGIFNSVVPGMILFVAGLAVVILIGFGSLLYAVITLSLRGINCFKGRRDLVLMLCVAAYIAPVFNLVPWVFVFGLYNLKPVK